MYAHSIIKDTSTSVGMEAAVSVDKRKDIIRDVFYSYYKDSNEVCFNTNRGWAADTSLLKELFPDFRMIICLRDIPWILDSFEQLNSKNAFTIKPLYHHQDLGSVYERTHMLMGNIPNFGGYVAGPLSNVRQSMYVNEINQLCYVEYDTLVNNPEGVIKEIYNFLGEPWFEHDFNNVEDSYDEFDFQAKIEGLHTVRKKVEYKTRRSILPDDLWQNYESSSFWKFNFEHKKNLNWINGSNITSIPKKVINNRIIPRLNKQL
jgi:sulfotransferase